MWIVPSFSVRLPVLKRGLSFITLIALAFVISTATAAAHVSLNRPNGGQELTVGSVEVVSWFDVVQHGPAVYDLWYSVTGSQGPWIEIASDLPPSSEDGTHSFQWTVPDMPTEQGRVRVRQDNSGTDYEDVSDFDFAIISAVAETTVNLVASRDATLYEGDGSLANGSGSYLFTGRTESRNGGLERRALLAFDLAGGIPAGSIITSVSLQLTMSRTIAGDQVVSLHSVLESWNQGPSDAPGQEGGGTAAQSGDVTWIHTDFPNSAWATPGGAFVASPSAGLTIGESGTYTYESTPQLVADVQNWLEAPSTNFGWALLISSPGEGTAKRFNSSEHSSSTSLPTLVVSYEEVALPPTAAFDVPSQFSMVGQATLFTDQSSGFPTEWMWDFGDGGTSTEQSPTHVFQTAGDFIVSLTVSNQYGSDTAQTTVSVLEGEEPDMSEIVFIPAVANSAGSGVSFFVTTADVHNGGSGVANFEFLWLPRDTDNADPQRFGTFTLEPGESRRFPNLVGDIFGANSALGAAAVVSDSTDIVVMTRTFNQNSNGTFGQGLVGVPSHELVAAGSRVRILFLTEDESFRSNLGLLNGVEIPIVVQWELFDRGGTFLSAGSAELPAWGNRQLNSILADFAPIEAAYADVWTTTTGGRFTCYGSVLDRMSSDPTTVLPR